MGSSFLLDIQIFSGPSQGWGLLLGDWFLSGLILRFLSLV